MVIGKRGNSVSCVASTACFVIAGTVPSPPRCRVFHVDEERKHVGRVNLGINNLAVVRWVSGFRWNTWVFLKRRSYFNYASPLVCSFQPCDQPNGDEEDTEICSMSMSPLETGRWNRVISLVQGLPWTCNNLLVGCSRNSLYLWKPKVHYRVYKSPPLDPILSQPTPVRPIDPYLPKVQLNVSSHLRLGLPSGLLPLGLPTKTL